MELIEHVFFVPNNNISLQTMTAFLTCHEQELLCRRVAKQLTEDATGMGRTAECLGDDLSGAIS